MSNHLHVGNGMVRVYHSAAAEPLRLAEDVACRQLLAFPALLKVCQTAHAMLSAYAGVKELTAAEYDLMAKLDAAIAKAEKGA